MADTNTERRMAENEVYFRTLNERLQQSVDEVNKTAAEDGGELLHIDKDSSFYFRCECADENCEKRLKMTLSEYQACHQSNKTFTIDHGHEIDAIEDIIKKTDAYTLVKKTVQTPRTATALNATPANNS